MKDELSLIKCRFPPVFFSLISGETEFIVWQFAVAWGFKWKKKEEMGDWNNLFNLELLSVSAGESGLYESSGAPAGPRGRGQAAMLHFPPAAEALTPPSRPCYTKPATNYLWIAILLNPNLW